MSPRALEHAIAATAGPLGTLVLLPVQFSAYFVVGTAVANTVANVVNTNSDSVAVIFSALIAATAWNYATWYVGMPLSSSHAAMFAVAWLRQVYRWPPTPSP